MVNIALVVADLLVLFSALFGIQAVLMFSKTNIDNDFVGLKIKEKHKLRLLYSTIFLGTTITLMAIIQMVTFTTTPISYLDLAMLAVYLALLSSTYSWYSFLKDTKR